MEAVIRIQTYTEVHKLGRGLHVLDQRMKAKSVHFRRIVWEMRKYPKLARRRGLVLMKQVTQ